MSLPEAGLFGSGLALASLWWNRAFWILRNWGLAAVVSWLLMVALPRERAEQRGDILHLKAVEHLDKASIGTVEKVWPLWLQTPSRFHWKKETQVLSMKVKPHMPCLGDFASLAFKRSLHVIPQRRIPRYLFSSLGNPHKILYVPLNQGVWYQHKSTEYKLYGPYLNNLSGCDGAAFAATLLLFLHP